jgi:hypothetical protein
MTHEQILKTAREILFKPTCDLENGCACCNGDIEGMFEYFDGAIGELIVKVDGDARRKSYSDGYDAAQADAMNGVFG